MSVYENRIVGYGSEPPEQLLANPQNWRKHPGAQQQAMIGVLEEVGWVQNVIVNQQTGHVIDGHMRISIAMRNNESEVPVTYVNLTPEEEALILASYDPIGSLATRDADLMHQLLQGIDEQENDALQALLDAERSEATRLLQYDHTQNIVKGEKPGRDQDDMLNDYLSTSVRQITLILNPETYAEALGIIQQIMRHYDFDTTAAAVLHLLREWSTQHDDRRTAFHRDAFDQTAEDLVAVAESDPF